MTLVIGGGDPTQQCACSFRDRHLEAPIRRRNLDQPQEHAPVCAAACDRVAEAEERCCGLSANYWNKNPGTIQCGYRLQCWRIQLGGRAHDLPRLLEISDRQLNNRKGDQLASLSPSGAGGTGNIS
jgi:hypothetical protein